MSQKLFVIGETDLNRMMGDAAKIGAVTALEKLEEEKEKKRKETSRKKLHNTNLLMKNYRILKAHSSQSVFEAAQMEESAADILFSMMSLKDDNIIVESIKKSAERTAIMMAHIDAMLDLYKKWCSNNELNNRRYDVLHQLYIADQTLTVAELAKCYHISKESVYADKNVAIKQLSSLLFGIDALK